MPHVFEGFGREVNSAESDARAQPLNKIRSRAKTNFDHLFSRIAGELGKRMNERLIEIAELLNLIKIFARELRRLRHLGVATLLVPVVANPVLKILSTSSNHGL